MLFLFASVAPALFIMYLVYRHDLEKEPINMIIKAFFGGIASVILSLVFSLPLSEIHFDGAFSGSFYTAFFLAAIPEELAKWIIFYLIIRKSKDFDQYYDGILYAIFISMGFALPENIMYIIEHGIGIAIPRAILAVPGHMLFAVPMGYYLSLSRFESGKDASIHIGFSLLIPIILHGIYDFLLMYASNATKELPILIILGILILFVVFDIYMWRLGLRKIRAHRAKDHSISIQNGKTS